MFKFADVKNVRCPQGRWRGCAKGHEWLRSSPIEVLQYNTEFILLKNNKKLNIVSMFPALAIPKAYIVLICTVVPKNFQRSFIGSKLLLIVCSIMGGIWDAGRAFLVVNFLEAPPSHSGHLFGGESLFLLKVWAPYIRCQHCKAPESVKSCSIMCNSCWKRDHAMGAWFQLQSERGLGFCLRKQADPDQENRD